jgi:hypothetical protein
MPKAFWAWKDLGHELVSQRAPDGGRYTIRRSGLKYELASGVNVLGEFDTIEGAMKRAVEDRGGDDVQHIYNSRALTDRPQFKQRRQRRQHKGFVQRYRRSRF